jgi:hypothetical protein
MDIDIDCVSSDEECTSPSQEEVTMMIEASVAVDGSAGPVGHVGPAAGNENNPSESSSSQVATMGKMRDYPNRKDKFNRNSKGGGSGGQSNKERFAEEENNNIAHKNFFQGQLYDDFDLEKF